MVGGAASPPNGGREQPPRHATRVVAISLRVMIDGMTVLLLPVAIYQQSRPEGRSYN
jgi:hypothetical protein